MKRNSIYLLVISGVISFIGILTLLSTELTSNFTINLESIFVKQIIFCLFGIFVAYLMSKFDYTLFKYKPIVIGIYVFTLLLLILTAIFGQEVNGARRWLTLFGVQLQPSEIAKITVILVTAYVFNTNEKHNHWNKLFKSLGYIFPIALLIYIQPHGSMSLLIIFLWFATSFFYMKDPVRNILLILVITTFFSGLFTYSAFNNPIYLLLTVFGIIISIFMYFAREQWRIPIIIALLGSVIFGMMGTILWNTVLDNYQRDRIVAFINPQQSDPNTTFNVTQSKIAIGSGGIWGKGFTNGTQSKLQFLPFYQTDFIFATYAEEFGLVGSIVLLSLYFILLWNIFYFSIDISHLRYESVIATAIGIKILVELFINLGTNLGISPATGIPLPLMSAGGTITVMTFFSLGLLQGIMSKINSQQSLSD